MLLYSGTHDKGKVGDLLGLFPLELKILLCWLPSWKRCPNGYTSPVVVANGNIDRDSPPPTCLMDIFENQAKGRF